MASIDNLLTAAALKYLNESAGKRSSEAIWRKAMVQYLGGGAGLGRLSLSALAARTARQVTGQTFSGASLDSLLLRWAYAIAPAGTPGRLSLNAVAIRAANKYLTAPPAPTNTVAPVVSGTPSVGQTLTTTNGTWTGSPTGYTYQWRRNGTAISGATANTYVVQAGDAGTTLTCTVIATNAGGSATAVSNGLAVAAGRTYAEWVTEANRLATGGALAWETPTTTLNSGSYTTAPSAATGGVLTGSSWNTFFKGTASAASAERIVQHGVQNASILSALRTGGFVVFLRIVGADATVGYVALDRNGYLSLSGAGNSLNGRACDLAMRWDDTLKKVFQWNPSIGGAETEYVW